MSNSTSPTITNAMIYSGVGLVIVMLGGITLNIAIGRDPGVLINFCGILISQGASFGFLYFKLDKVSNTVEEQANGGGDRKMEAAVRRGLTGHVEDTLAQEKIQHPAGKADNG